MTEIDVSKAVQRSRPPARVVRGDDFQQVQDGRVYHPHAREEVRFLGECSNGFVEDVLRYQALAMQALQEGGGMLSLEDNQEMAQVLERLRVSLSRHIAAWTWSDFRGEPLPSPPTVEVLRELPFLEFFFLTNAFMPEIGAPLGESIRLDQDAPPRKAFEMPAD